MVYLAYMERKTYCGESMWGSNFESVAGGARRKGEADREILLAKLDGAGHQLQK